MNAKEGLIVTGDTFVDSPDKIKEILTNFPEALACEMAHSLGINFLKSRTIPVHPFLSHYAEEISGSPDERNLLDHAHQWQRQFNIPFLIVRAMSDTADHSATQSFDEFIEDAGKRSAEMVIEFVKHLV